MRTIIPYEMIIRLGFFFGVIIIMSVWEILAPRRKVSVAKSKRWFGNLGIVAINSFALRLLFPASAVGVAFYAKSQNWGLFHHIAAPTWLAFIVVIILLDLTIYLQHVMFHAIPNLWRVHRMHHLDLDFDTTTGVRFHPIEIILSMSIKSAAIFLLGASPMAVLAFEVLLSSTSLFNHGNVRIPLGLDKIIRCVIVTPDMHRVHHSIEPNETNSNFGFNFSFWDRLFATYKSQPQAGHTEMTIGLKSMREPKLCVNLLGMLVVPFIGKITDYAINRRRK